MGASPNTHLPPVYLHTSLTAPIVNKAVMCVYVPYFTPHNASSQVSLHLSLLTHLSRACRPLLRPFVVPCSASSQVFFLLKESELTPSGANLLDGRYAVFGYAVQGQDSLGLMKVGVLIMLLQR